MDNGARTDEVSDSLPSVRQLALCLATIRGLEEQLEFLEGALESGACLLDLTMTWDGF